MQVRRQMQYLSEPELDQIEEQGFKLLAEVGISLQHKGAQEMLHGLGCRIENGRAYIPPSVVEWTLANITSHTEFYNRDGSPAFTYGDGKLRFHNAGGLPFFFDLETGERRRPTLEDVADATRLLDALENVDVIIPAVGPVDVPSEMLAVASTDVMIRHTNKPFSAAAIDHPQDVPFVVEMAAACCGGMEAFRARPTMYASISPISPMIFPYEIAETLIRAAQLGMPINSLPCPSLGATAPITVAGALALQHAEVLASFVIAAAAHPGAPVTYCSRINPIDVRTALSSWGGPYIGMCGAGACQLAHRHAISFDTFGLCTSAVRLDPQFAYERMANALLPALGGADILSGVGGTDSVLTWGLDVATMDDEIASMIKYIVTGPQVSEEVIGYRMMEKVIPDTAMFLSEAHTVKQMRRGAIWWPTTGRKTGGSNEPDGDLMSATRERTRHLLATHQPPPLPDDILQHLDEILERARRELVK